MELVCATLRNSVGNTARGASVLSRVTRSVDLEFFNRRLADYVRNAGAAALFSEERLIVVASVNGIVVEQARDATETDQAERAVRNGAGGQDRELGPAAAVDRQFVNRGLIDVAGK